MVNTGHSHPTDKSFTKQLDITSVKVAETNEALKLTLNMSDVTDTWSPKNGFDHIYFNIFLQDPNKQGATVMPKQNANVPTGFNWSYDEFVGGWENIYNNLGL